MRKITYLALLFSLHSSTQAIVFQNDTDACLNFEATYTPQKNLSINRKISLLPQSVQDIPVSEFLLRKAPPLEEMLGVFCVMIAGTANLYDHSQFFEIDRFHISHTLKFNALEERSFDQLERTTFIFSKGSLLHDDVVYNDQLVCHVETLLLLETWITKTIKHIPLSPTSFFSEKNL